MCIATNCSWYFVYWVIILECIFVTSCVLFYYVCTAVSHTLLPDCWLEVSIRKVLRQATSAQVFLVSLCLKAICS